jgi:hypothetical protein
LPRIFTDESIGTPCARDCWRATARKAWPSGRRPAQCRHSTVGRYRIPLAPEARGSRQGVWFIVQLNLDGTLWIRNRSIRSTFQKDTCHRCADATKAAIGVQFC